ncbi:VapE domain-containing protein [Pollutibacter soli]|uniref:VapE domain-containing protein n=1 Tax=Pollutibacter soli TaxID=3034157 RepID=UPI00301326F4
MNKDTNILPVGEIECSFFELATRHRGVIKSLSEICEQIKTGKFKNVIDEVRSKKSVVEKKEYQNLKLSLLPAFSPGVKYKPTALDKDQFTNPDDLTGLFPLDLDHPGQDNEKIKSILREFPWIVMVCISAGGKDLFAIGKCDRDRYHDSYITAVDQLAQHGIRLPEGQQNPNRLRYLSYDPDLYFNSYAVDIQIPSVVILSPDNERHFLKILDTHNHKTGSKYWIAGERNHHITSVAGSCNQKKMSREFTIRMIEKHCGDMIQDFTSYNVAEEVDKVYTQYRHQHGANPWPTNGVEKQTKVEQLEYFLTQRYKLRRNVITRKIEINGIPAEVKELNTVYLAGVKEINKLGYEIFERLIHSHFTPDYNPLLEFFEANKSRTPTGLIDKLFGTIKNGMGFEGREFFPQYAEHFGKKWFVGLIASAYGHHSPLLLVLSGMVQGTGKTEWFRRLLPAELKQYYAESKLDREKDDEILMTQKWLVMDDEMGGKSKRDVTRLKEVLSKDEFTLREPYGRHNVTIKRLAVLCGTSNDSELLHDPTGNRRIIPIDVESIDQETYNSIDKTDLLMEAWHLYQSGFNWRLTSDDIKHLKENTKEFEVTNPEFDLFTKMFEIPGADNTNVIEFTSSEVKSKLETRFSQKLNSTKLGIEIKKLGGERFSVRRNGAVVKVYRLIDKNP